jgi:hypothetical protein
MSTPTVTSSKTALRDVDRRRRLRAARRDESLERSNYPFKLHLENPIDHLATSGSSSHKSFVKSTRIFAEGEPPVHPRAGPDAEVCAPNPRMDHFMKKMHAERRQRSIERRSVYGQTESQEARSNDVREGADEAKYATSPQPSTKKTFSLEKEAIHPRSEPDESPSQHRMRQRTEEPLKKILKRRTGGSSEDTWSSTADVAKGAPVAA